MTIKTGKNGGKGKKREEKSKKKEGNVKKGIVVKKRENILFPCLI